MTAFRYLGKEKFLRKVWQNFRSYFPRLRSLRKFVDAIPTDERRDEFLRLALFYIYLVRIGEFRVREAGRKQYVDYLDLTYKYVALFSLIEALRSEHSFVDFYEWLRSRRRRGRFPIQREDLDRLYREYKREHGAIQKAAAFFTDDLDDGCRDLLSEMIRLKRIRRGGPTGQGSLQPIDQPVAAEKVAAFLYLIRSQFVHEAKLVLEFGGSLTIGRRGESIIQSHLSIEDLQRFYEHGLLRHFGYSEPLPHPR